MHWNRPRHRGSPHVESWFVRANDPKQRRALWLKTTLLDSGTEAQAEAWCVLFDAGRVRAWRETVPLAQARLEPVLEIAGCRLELALTGGSARGRLGPSSWDLRWSGPRQPLCPYPLQAMIDGALPRNKTLTPVPVATLSGRVEVEGETWELEGWPAAQGHNWGRAHPLEYAWGQCVFPGRGWVEGFSGRILLAGRPSPLLSVLVVQVDGRTWRFDRILDLWRQRPALGDLSWSLAMSSRRATAELHLEARPEEVASLAYPNPDGSVSTCLNSKLSRASLVLRPRGEPALALGSSHGAALERLSAHPHPDYPHIV